MLSSHSRRNSFLQRKKSIKAAEDDIKGPNGLRGAASIISMIQNRPKPVILEENTSDLELNHTEIPEPDQRVHDLMLGTLLNGTWQMRRVVITKEKLSFALLGEENEIDLIPLSEVTSIEEMNGGEEEISPGQQGSLKTLLQKSMRMGSDNDIDFQVDENSTSRLFVNAFHIATIADGYNSGRSYYLQAESSAEKLKIIEQLRALNESAKKRAEVKTLFRKVQERVRKVYNTRIFQCSAAFLIVANFAANIVEAQLLNSDTDARGTYVGRAMDISNMFFTAVFTVELVINMIAYWMQPFLTNPWSMLDAFVVLMSLVALGPVDIPITIMRLMRAFRVIRLFGRLKALKKMVSALSASIIPMMNAFLILFIISSIYAIMGVSIFGIQAPQEFGQFDLAFVTMFRLTTDGGWPVSIPQYDEDGGVNWKCAAFMMSYIVVVNWVVLQVSVAVLLDNFVSASSAIEEEEAQILLEDKKRRKLVKNPLEPLLKKIAKEFVDNSDLTVKLHHLYRILDTDGSGSLSMNEFCASIKKLNFTPRIHIAPSDYVAFTHGGTLCDERGQLGLFQFELAMREQILLYIQGQLTNVDQHRHNPFEAELMNSTAIKWLLLVHQAPGQCIHIPALHQTEQSQSVEYTAHNHLSEKNAKDNIGMEETDQCSKEDHEKPLTDANDLDSERQSNILGTEAMDSRDDFATCVANAVSKQLRRLLRRHFCPAHGASLPVLHERRRSRRVLLRRKSFPISDCHNTAAQNCGCSADRAYNSLELQPALENGVSADLNEADVEANNILSEPFDFGNSDHTDCQNSEATCPIERKGNGMMIHRGSSAQDSPRHMEFERNRCTRLAMSSNSQTVEVSSTGGVSISVTAALVSVVVEQQSNTKCQTLLPNSGRESPASQQLQSQALQVTTGPNNSDAFSRVDAVVAEEEAFKKPQFSPLTAETPALKIQDLAGGSKTLQCGPQTNSEMSEALLYEAQAARNSKRCMAYATLEEGLQMEGQLLDN